MDNKKMAAATAAVFEYIRSEEEALCLQAAAAGRAAAPAVAIPPAAPARLWAVGGRQQQMQLRSLMQWRAFAGARLR